MATVTKYVNVEVEVDLALHDFSDEEIIAEARDREMTIDLLSDDDYIISQAMKIVQNHRSGREWQADALELLYELANKVV